MDTLPAKHDHFLSLLAAHQRALLKVCWVYGNTSHDRDDLLQEIIGQLWASFGRYDRNRKFSTWMYRVALNVAIDYRRRLHRHKVRETASLNESGAEVPAATSEEDARQQQSHELRELLDQQPDDDRALLLLYLESHSLREIGEILGISESNVSTRLYRLKKTLKQTVQGLPEEQGV